MAGEGQLLRTAREEKGWSLLQAEEVTKIRVRYLEAMEAENYSILPGATYVRGFLRTYSKNLGLNPEEIVELYKANEPVFQPKIEPVLTIPRKRPVWVRPMIAVVVGLLAIGTVAGIATITQSKGGSTTASDYTPAPLPSAPKVEQPKSAGDASNAQSQTNSDSNQQSVPNAMAATTEGLKAQLVFTQPCWVVVNVDGKQALEGTNTQGTTKELTANEKIELVTVGNAGGISITLNGKAIPSLGASGQVVHNVVLTKDTLNQLSTQTPQTSVQPQ
ncbi:helix-turn-helix domain-containing protein [Desulfitobacterium sp. AusDCA]|uniref:helix-turn-helix domain-containing protein n=1 Tax=Desulfitobacterium sp. AusDCA TaxID=3240383 RepID=UPI003DA725E7